MDFIKALEKALGLGVTKEEFMHFWEAESRTNSKSKHGSYQRGISSQISQNDINDNHDKRGDPLINQCQQAKDELRQDLQLDLQRLFSHEIEKYEKQWKQLQDKNNQTNDDFRQQVGIVYQHVSNTAESQASSLKLYFMQELSLLRQEFGRMIDDLNVKNGGGHVSSGVSQHQLQMSFPRVCNTQPNIAGFGKTSEDDDDSHSAYDWHVEGQEETTFHLDSLERNSVNEPTQEHEILSLCSESKELDGDRSIFKESSRTNKSSATKQDTGSQEDSSLSGAASVMSINDKCIEDTGFYAEAISNQIKQNYSRKSDKSGSDTLKDIIENKTFKSVVYASNAHASSNKVNYTHWSGFTIKDSDQFSISDTTYLSPFMYPGTKSWKAQLCISFNAAQQLKVKVFISKGETDDDHEWPLTFRGFGYIFHLHSGYFTQIWELNAVTCQKPSPTKEVGFPVSICLDTKRGSYPNVKYKELQSKHYTDNNKLTFKWNLKAETIKQTTKTNSARRLQ